MLRHRFNYLLVMLILLLLSAPLMRHLGEAARIVFSSLVLGILVSAVLAVSERRKQLVTAVTLLVAAILPRAISLLMSDQDESWFMVKTIGLVIEMMLYGYTIGLIVRYVLAAPRVSFDMICAALCAYLLIGVLWSHLYILLTALELFEVGVLESVVFSPGLLGEETHSALDRIDKMFINALYVSFVTLSTLGYGDVTPVADLARMSAVVEAIIGQFYLAVLVARLVGLHIAGAAADEDPEKSE